MDLIKKAPIKLRRTRRKYTSAPAPPPPRASNRKLAKQSRPGIFSESQRDLQPRRPFTAPTLSAVHLQDLGTLREREKRSTETRDALSTRERREERGEERRKRREDRKRDDDNRSGHRRHRRRCFPGPFSFPFDDFLPGSSIHDHSVPLNPFLYPIDIYPFPWPQLAITVSVLYRPSILQPPKQIDHTPSTAPVFLSLFTLFWPRDMDSV